MVEFLREEQSLLILDTCEHLVDSCAMLAEILLSSCPGLCLLLTSRQTLDVPAEHTLAVAPLEGDDSVRLFTERAAAARPGFALTSANEEQVAALCRRLDGIPLALELAAVRLRALPLDQVLRRLEDRFRALGGGRGAHPRHQTLRTAIDWSHELCTPEERTLWARLSVCAGGFDLTAAEQVCADAELDAYDIGDHLIGLVDKSIVIREEGEEDNRYRMLDTLREYGAERLAESGDQESAERRHRDHCLHLARLGNVAWSGPEQATWTDRFEREIDNFRVAMEWSLTTPGEESGAVALCGALVGLWVGRGRVVEGLRWGGRAWATGAGTPADRGRLGFQRGVCKLLTGDRVGAVEILAEGAELSLRGGDLQGRLLNLEHLFGAYSHVDRLDDARRAGEECEPLVHALKDPYLLGLHYRNGADRHLTLGDTQAAELLLQRGLEVLPRGEFWLTSVTHLYLSLVRIANGDLDDALKHGRESLRGMARLQDMVCVSNHMSTVSWIAAAQSRHGEAARLYGAAAGIRRGIAPLLLGDPKLNALDRSFQRASEQALGEEEFRRLYEEGERMGLPQALALGLGESAAPESATASALTLDSLTRREREVAALVHQGLSNREIAERIVISKRTADAHVEHILAKLGVASRCEVAALVRAETENSRT
ncbi:LuxR family transcriptional regulator [Streptomyces sp. TRM66268-LWL]|uniref:LuxR family transcriptional regulator n=1 Tax=Streptomyces polyasparticus TaxID=2767826 RepID=A0ABR7SQ91_9ACTN|nr:LuxR C-terminal-related transcriptional regulator [Streptomyces polyasparticus]MBC9717660.1 LuxR family transcriptional regulator [Streptomyces polyasparticus]